ncbi:MAG: CdaR family protein [Desulfovibrionaceae bacterium]|nr:CdaR family protein [Desulfovibrionaceae bacterium]
MSFSNKKQSLALHIISILLSVCIATAMWYMVSVRDRIEMQVDVNIDYIGIPKNLIVTDGLIKKVTVRVRGPEALLRGLNSPHLNQQIDLSLIKKGVTIVPLTAERLSGYYRSFDVLDVQPPRIVVKADNVVERMVPIQPEVRSTLRKGAVTVSDVVVNPASVSLWGPESVVSEITSLRLPIEIDPKAAGTSVQQTMPLDAPGLVTVTPKNVRVSYTVTSRRVTVAHKYRIVVSSDNPGDYVVTPKDTTLTVEVPETLAKNLAYLNELKLNVIPPATLKPGEDVIVPVHYRIPDGMTVLQPRLENVTISGKHDN